MSTTPSTRERTLLFRITETTQYSAPHRTEHARLIVLTHDNQREVRGCCGYGETDRAGWIPEDALNDLVIEASIATDMESTTYAWGVAYLQPYHLDLYRARAMVKTLETVQRKLDRLTARYGEPADFGQYVARVAEALNATTIAFDQQPSTTGTWSRGEYRFRPVGEAVGTINHAIFNWHERYPSTARQYDADAS